MRNVNFIYSENKKLAKGIVTDIPDNVSNDYITNRLNVITDDEYLVVDFDDKFKEIDIEYSINWSSIDDVEKYKEVE